jgi:hypothetical protein
LLGQFAEAAAIIRLAFPPLPVGMAISITSPGGAADAFVERQRRSEPVFLSRTVVSAPAPVGFGVIGVTAKKTNSFER